jgi:uncharacterized protein
MRLAVASEVGHDRRPVMTRSETTEKMQSLCLSDANVPSPHRDCRTVASGIGSAQTTISISGETMSRLYSDQHRALQDRFDSRRMADLMEGGLLHTEFAPEDKAFIESRDMFFLSTVDAGGCPTVSYKGGAPGFVRILGSSTLAFPCYDGNGMYYSMGNIMVAPKAGLLFIDFETPHRLRVHGSAELLFEHTLLSDFPEAQFMVSIAVESIWINCPRYIHPYQKLGTSKYVPVDGCETPTPTWKRIDIVQQALPLKDQGKAKSLGGEINFETYAELLAKGEA